METTGPTVEFLKKIPIFERSSLEILEQIAGHCEEKHFKQGDLILQQGRNNDAYYMLRSGRVAVRVERLTGRETVETLDPPSIFGELSCITGEPCSADIEVIYDSDVLVIEKEALTEVGRRHPDMLSGMVRLLARRLHTTVVRGTRAPEFPVVLLREHPHWEAPASFSEGLTESLAQQIGKQALLVRIGSDQGSDHDSGDLQELGPGAFVTNWRAGDRLRDELVEQLPRWQERFKALIFYPASPDGLAVAARIAEVVTEYGDLLGPGDPCPEEEENAKHFIVGSGEKPVLPILNGSRQLLFDAVQSERNYRDDKPVTARFRHTLDSIARHILDIQVGLACGGGAAWGFAHIGVFKALENAGVPIDVVAGNSAGTLIGGMRCCGHSPLQIREHVMNLTRSRLRLFEWRIWKLHMIRESTIRKNFARAYGDVHVNQTEIPFWANALNIETGEEVNITNGPLSAAVRASICLPGLFPPVVHDNALLIDAGMTDSVPVNQIRDMGCRFAIATNVMQDLKKHTLGRKYPRNLLQVVYRALQACGHEIGAARCERASDVIIKPDAGPISMLAFHEVDKLNEAGERAAQEQLPLILAAYDRLKARC